MSKNDFTLELPNARGVLQIIQQPALGQGQTVSLRQPASLPLSQRKPWSPTGAPGAGWLAGGTRRVKLDPGGNGRKSSPESLGRPRVSGACLEARLVLQLT